MALVKVVRDNLLSGANLQKLEVGAQVSVSGDVAKRWLAAGLVEIISDDDQTLEVATPGMMLQSRQSRQNLPANRRRRNDHG